MIIERNNAKPARWTTWLGLILVPVLIAGGMLAATWNSDDRLDTVAAAVVNLDEAVTLNGEYVPLGRQLTAALVDSDRVQNLNWVQASEEGARAGLASGKFAATVIIPKEFSAAATSYAGDADQAHPAVIRVETSPVAGIADATLGKVVAQEAARVLNETLTSAYLEQIYIGFNEMGEQFVTIADGAAELADGAEQLADGVAQAADGSGKLTDGAEQLADGMGQAASGAGELVSGINRFASGLNTMADQSAPLVPGSRALADGVRDAADGAGQLAAGMDAYAAGARQYADGVAALPANARQLSDGVGQYVGGINQIVDPLLEGVKEQQELLEWIKRVTGDQESLNEAIAVLKQLRSQLEALDTLAGLSGQEIAEKFDLPCPDELAALPDGCRIYYRALEEGVGVAADTMAKIQADADLGPIIKKLQELPELLEGIQLPEGGVDLEAMLTQLRDGGQQLADGASALADGMVPVAQGAEGLADGAEQLAGGVGGLAGGLSQAADGADEFADGMVPLVAGIDQAATGARQLADGAKALPGGLSQLAGGAGELADGSGALTEGLVEAADGGAQLADGARELADGLAEGKDQLPSYSESDRSSLSEIVASPVSTTNLLGTATLGTGWVTLLMVLALWAGALATFIVMKAVSSRLLGSAQSSARLVAEALLPGMVVVGLQSVVIAAIGQAALQLPFGKLLGMLGLLLVAGLAFVAINHALAAWWGSAGRLVALGLAVLGMASMLTSAEPAVFGVLRGFSPLTPALDAIRSLITESGAVATNLFLLLLWLLAGLAASAIAVLRHRSTSFADLLAAHGVTT